MGVFGLISEVQAQVPNAQGASFSYSLILSGLWGAQLVQENQGHPAPNPHQDLQTWRWGVAVFISVWSKAGAG